MNNKEKILKGLEPLYKKAEEEGLWFHSNYQDMWFSPEELKKKQEKGTFIWSAINWDLADPIKRLKYLKDDKESAEKEYNDFKELLGE